MKQIIRLSTFETNSSSMHSLVVLKNPKPYLKEEKRLAYTGEEDFDLFGYDDGHFGRSPFKVLRWSREKLRYWVAYYIGTLGRTELIPEVIDLIHKHTNIPKDKIEIKVYDQWADLRDKDDYYNAFEYGHVEHNDYGDPLKYLEENNISLEEFIFNPKYIIVTDGDEYMEFKHLMDSGLIDTNNIEFITQGLDSWLDEYTTYHCYINWIANDLPFDEIREDVEDVQYKKTIHIEDDPELVQIDDKVISRSIEYLDLVKKFNKDIRIEIETNRPMAFEPLVDRYDIFFVEAGKDD